MNVKTIKTAFANDPLAIARAARYRFNCNDVDVDEVGDVWIADPQSGHWLDNEKIIDLAKWIENVTGQSIFDWLR